ncbi:His-Xaa-Ser system radical SAM maturase HxsC [Oryzomonas rubra]|uniref:His-Xaa-Ser system radical SAM maturase HxsC n=1 Tax=Oryzomonas rubra TaxID=2509454 RepID=A0A5A9XQD5_9BACT|nr:His-Xaa-Ser system radical SAM maturase HxsC [Oryzomonas rubra]KAA0894239.1 His-Xaa-Ser system radical SAM maturase HxsC [Oryzomonas rubra]
MKQFKGIAANIDMPVLGLVSRNPFSLSRCGQVLVSEGLSLLAKGFSGVITGEIKDKTSQAHVKLTDGSSELVDGDCVLIDKDGMVTVVWEKHAPMNPLLLTEACDCQCLMCPQPPKVHEKRLTETAKKILNLVKVGDDQTICLTGGEPTLLKEDFFAILELIGNKHPNSNVMMLTNGKSFADFQFTKRFVQTRPANFISCVSMHSDVDEVHDRIVGIKDSFYKTAMGLQNLARFREKIEIRVVVNRLNAQRLEAIANFIQRNFPFIYHCAFMGMEITGLARDNYEDVWIDPYDYRDQLSKAVKVLSRANMYVSIYNLPLCLLKSASWAYARKSISGWKKDYVLACESCSKKEDCCGIFTTSGLHLSPHIQSIL